MRNVRSVPMLRVGVAVFLLVTGIFLGFLAPSLLAVDEPGDQPTTYTVREGDSIWGIARQFAPGVDPRSFLYELKRLNGLRSSAIYPGQRLILPSF